MDVSLSTVAALAALVALITVAAPVGAWSSAGHKIATTLPCTDERMHRETISDYNPPDITHHPATPNGSSG